jgi:predicted 3-demethylubiquinone-9 3-methyltransferase (glyoxalase superfamily)
VNKVVTRRPGECELCFNECVPGSILCDACQEWDDYWNGLTDEQQRLEIARMNRYAAERDQW